ncbi:MAG: SAM-dependent chlorinase/fluorinase [Bryobacteraceae bacterium]
MPERLITFTTDFGTTDYFAGAMKGVIAGIAPKARVIDITHEILPYDINQAGFVISQAWTCFPKGTIHVVIVDPGVGSARRPILVEAGGHFFIGPDNGVFSMIYDAVPHKVRVITNTKVFRKNVSRTFHGRDVFAPAAAHLAKGMPPMQIGKIIHDEVRSWNAQPTKIGSAKTSNWRGAILKVDRFGNLITNFHIDRFDDVKTHAIELRAGKEKIRRLALTYSETEIGELFAIVGSSGYLEIAANQANAAARIGCSAGAPVELDIF